MRQRVVLIDLDETLYEPSVGLFARIQTGMLEALESLEGLDRQAAEARRAEYVRTDGMLYHALVRRYPGQLETILQFIFPAAVEQYLSAAPDLRAALAAIPARKVIFTHAPEEFAGRVLDTLGIADQFETIFGGRRLNFASKRDINSLQTVLTALAVDAVNCLMVDDRIANLALAHQLGLTTIWIDWQYTVGDRPAAIDYRAHGTLEALQIVRRQVLSAESIA